MKKINRCPAHGGCFFSGDRRYFIKNSLFLTAGISLLGSNAFAVDSGMQLPLPKSSGQASSYVPLIKIAFVRRKEEYGMLWPGAIYDGEAAMNQYTEQLRENATALNLKADLREFPLYSNEDADLWLQEAKAEDADGLILMVLDRQKHSWPTAYKAAESGIPLVVFSPLGTAFTTNTGKLAGKSGCVVYSTNNFNQLVYGMKMLKAKARMKRTRCVVIKGDKEEEKLLADTGITLKYLPAGTFIDLYNKTPDSNEIIDMAGEYIRQATSFRGADKQDVINGIKSYLIAGQLLKAEKADAISMDCLGALGDKKVSLPCIAWSRMNDDGIPAACEADTGAIASQIIVQYLFDRPGFQQDPVADTSDDTIIGAHCSCPNRLNGFGLPPEPFDIVHHHGNRDAVPRPVWKTGHRVTCIDFIPAAEVKQPASQMLISAGTVVENMSAPPSGGCVVSVKVKFDNTREVLDYPGFHQLFFYGDFKKELEDFCQLSGFEAKII